MFVKNDIFSFKSKKDFENIYAKNDDMNAPSLESPTKTKSNSIMFETNMRQRSQSHHRSVEFNTKQSLSMQNTQAESELNQLESTL
jgi:hypothetical protein